MASRDKVLAVCAVLALFASVALSGVATAQPGGGSLLPPEGPPAPERPEVAPAPAGPTGGEPPARPGRAPETGAQPPLAPPEQPPSGGPPSSPPTVPGAGAMGTGGAPAFDENAPDRNIGFPTDRFPEDIRAELGKILPQGEREPGAPISMAFDRADISEFLKFLATESGYTIIPPAELSGEVTIVSQVDVGIDDAFAILEAWLRTRNFASQRDDRWKIITIIPIAKAQSRAIPVHIDDGDLDTSQPTQFVTHIKVLRYVEATKVREVLANLVDAERGSMQASADLNALIITDETANVARIIQIVDELDRPLEAVSFEVYELKYAAAKELADSLSQLFTSGSALPAEVLQRMGIDPATVQQGPTGFVGAALQVKIVPYERTNTLIISASETRMKFIKSIIEQLDRDTTPPVMYRVFQLENADASQVAESLNQIFEQPQGGPGQAGGRQLFRFPWDTRQTETTKSFYGLKENIVIADVRTNSVIVTASAENMRAFEEIIEQLDKSRALSEVTRVYALKNAMAADLATVLNQAFRGRGGQQGGGFLSFIFGDMAGGAGARGSGPLQQLRDITVTAEEKSNALIVTAPPQAFEMLQQVIDELDQPQKQVYIRVIIADVTLNDNLRYGVEWNWYSRSNPSFTGSSSFGLSSSDRGVRWGIIGDNVQGFLGALEEQTSIRVLSTQSILTMDNVQGTISSGREVTIRTGQRESGAGFITDLTDRVEAAIRLQVTPRISESGLVRMSIVQTVDDIGQTDSYGNPELIKREGTADVLVRSGETVVLGGIIQDDRRVTKREVPILKEIPLLGNLFRWKDETTRRSELMIFITPYTLEDEEAARTIRRQEIDRMGVDLEAHFPELRESNPTEGTASAPVPAPTPSTTSERRELGPPVEPAPRELPPISRRVR